VFLRYRRAERAKEVGLNIRVEKKSWYKIGEQEEYAKYRQLKIMILKLLGALNIWGLKSIILMMKQKKSKLES